MVSSPLTPHAVMDTYEKRIFRAEGGLSDFVAMETANWDSASSFMDDVLRKDSWFKVMHASTYVGMAGRA